MNSKTTIFILLIVLSLLLISSIYNNQENKTTAIIKINNTNIEVEIADTPEKWQLGLSKRKDLDNNRGMLFIFPEERIASFWMKDMEFPLDIIWINSSMRIIGIAENIQPESFPETFSHQDPVLYVLEVNSGWAQQNEIQAGMQVEINQRFRFQKIL